jgi:D-glycero-D-manno-heptose 1,7-bisphosphate phosphatase
MLLRAGQELGIDLSRSFVVGDSVVDMQAGLAVGATTILVLTGYGRASREECWEKDIRIAHVAESVARAVDFILDAPEGRMPQ